MHYILDGYNITKRFPKRFGGDLAQSRRELLAFIDARRPQGSVNNQVTVVFDGRPDVSSPALISPARVIFSQGSSADVVIKQMVDIAPRRAEIVVVSDDRGLCYYCRAGGVRIMPVAVFCRSAVSATQQRHRKKAVAAESRSAVSPEQQQRITAELYALWVEKKQRPTGGR